ncbi:MAG: AEC family transporter [Victivallaceae bacterium]|nr:AEC family transporter [Victivallaceae bacterium]
MTRSLVMELASLFLVMASGFTLVKGGFLRREAADALSRIMLYLVIPCATLRAFQVSLNPDITRGLVFSLALAIGVHAVFLASQPLLQRIFKLDVLETLSVIYPNSCNLSLPLVAATMGWEMTVYISTYVSVQQFLFWSHGRMKMCGVSGIDLKKIFGNVNIIAVLLGIAMFATGIRLPRVVARTVNSVSDMIGPATMLVAGILLASLDSSVIRRYPRAWIVIALRLVVVPFVFTLAFKLSGLAALVPMGRDIILVTLFSIITPPATTLTLMAQVYGKDAVYANMLTMVSTVIGMATMPLMVWFYLL